MTVVAAATGTMTGVTLLTSSRVRKVGGVLGSGVWRGREALHDMGGSRTGVLEAGGNGCEELMMKRLR